MIDLADFLGHYGVTGMLALSLGTVALLFKLLLEAKDKAILALTQERDAWRQMALGSQGLTERAAEIADLVTKRRLGIET